MVQDLIEYNMYCSAMWRTERSGPSAGKKRLVSAKYRDVPARPDDEPTSATSLARRFSAYLVPVPGETSWARAASLGPERAMPRRGAEDIRKAAEMMSKRSSKKRKARSMDEDDDTLDASTESASCGASAAAGGGKGSGHSSGASSAPAMETGEDGEGAEDPGEEESMGGSAKRARGFGAIASDDMARVGPLPLEAFSPTPGSERELPCLARMYDSDVEPSPLRIGQVVEMIGIYTHDPMLA